MLRLLFKYKWMVSCQDLKKRKDIILTFFEMVSMQNCTNAVNRGVPISYESQERILREVCEKSGVRFEVRSIFD